MKIYIFGNGNLPFSVFRERYEKPLLNYTENKEVEFLVCDYKGVDTLAMEVLKDKTAKVSVLHIGEKPRYLPDKFKTKVADWNIIGGFTSDAERDQACITACTHFIATDFNSDSSRKSGTQKNIELCEKSGKIKITDESITG